MGLAGRHLPFTILYPRFSSHARVVKWQTRTFEGRMPQGMGVQVPPRALSLSCPPVGRTRPVARAEAVSFRALSASFPSPQAAAPYRPLAQPFFLSSPLPPAHNALDPSPV